MSEPVLSEADLARVEAAVGIAERRTSGEIVPYIVRQSADYDAAVWRAASAGALVATALVLALAALYGGWSLAWTSSPWAVAGASVGGGLAGALLGAFVPGIRRAAAGPGALTAEVHRRAAQAFLDEEVFNTRDRTGILLFVSLFEHRIEVLGDAGINEKVETAEWVEVVERIRVGILHKDLAGGLVAAIEMCGDLLERRGVEVRHDDTDELSDRVRLRDE